MPTGSAAVAMLCATAAIRPAVSGRATNAVALLPGIVDSATSHAFPPRPTAVVALADTAMTIGVTDAAESTLDPCTATTWPAGVTTPSTSPVPITDVSAMSVARRASGAATSWSVASCRPTPAMKPASDACWPSSRFAAIDALSAALFSACVRALASASISGTTAMVIPATRITAANFNENEASRQMPLSLRTPRNRCPQPDRRIRRRDTVAMVAATRTVERAITGTAPTPPAPSAPTGVTAGIVSSGGARTGGLEPDAGSCSRDGTDEVCVVVMPTGAARPPEQAPTGLRGAGEAARFGCDAGAEVAVAFAVGSGDSLGRGEGYRAAAALLATGVAIVRVAGAVHDAACIIGPCPGSFEPLETAGAAPSKCAVTPAAATGTSSAPNSIQNSDAPAMVIKRARLISKSPPGRCYGRPRLDL